MSNPEDSKDADTDFDALPLTMRGVKRIMSCLAAGFILFGLFGLLGYGTISGRHGYGPFFLQMMGIGLWGVALLLGRWCLSIARYWDTLDE